jgi:hypothetical protein
MSGAFYALSPKDKNDATSQLGQAGHIPDISVR